MWIHARVIGLVLLAEHRGDYKLSFYSRTLRLRAYNRAVRQESDSSSLQSQFHSSHSDADRIAASPQQPWHAC